MTTQGGDGAAARWVEAYAQAWRAPADADDLVRRLEPWLRSDYQFRQPLTRGVRVGLDEFRRRFARPVFDIMRDVQGTVEAWAESGDIVFIETSIAATIGRRPVQLLAVDRVRLRDGLAVDRHTFVDPLPLLAAAARTPRAWWPLLRQLLTGTSIGSQA